MPETSNPKGVRQSRHGCEPSAPKASGAPPNHPEDVSSEPRVKKLCSDVAPARSDERGTGRCAGAMRACGWYGRVDGQASSTPVPGLEEGIVPGVSPACL